MKLLLIVLQLTFMTYNVENLFDTGHDSLKNDTSFTANGAKKWDNGRMRTKIHHIMQVIAAQDELPVVVGLCEVENDSVLTFMTSGRYSRLGYGFVHYESSDPRGIDVALLFRKDIFTVDTSFPIKLGTAPREAHYMKGHLRRSPNVKGCVIHFIQLHLPSRRGGSIATSHLRCDAASFVKSATDSILATDSLANIIIMGDFNDTPSDPSLINVMNALPPSDTPSCSSLYNLAWPLHDEGLGTYFHQGEWNMLDNIIVSGAMLNGASGISLLPSASIYSPSWLQDKKGHPRRTYLGDFYQGGTSDHFPLFVTTR